jgi:BirA family transcriptional regulator, biotin operon repressor / biotin---[acetyl-CoA-carboxylase] ligase
MPLLPEQVVPRLRGRFGHPYVWRDECPSTQDLARDLPHGGVAATDHQTAGRGRRGRRWTVPAGKGLLFSLALEPRTPPGGLAAFSLVAAEAVATACDDGALVRWPNDVVIGEHKLAGVLPELRDGKLVVGVGINTAMTAGELPRDVRVPPTSLEIVRGQPVDRVQLLVDLLAELELRFDAFEREGFPGLARDELRGRPVVLAGGVSGTAQGVDPDGRLVVDGRAYASAEVERIEAVGGLERNA